MFSDPLFSGATVNSLILGLAAGVIGTLLYALIAWVLVRTRILGPHHLACWSGCPGRFPALCSGVTLLSLMLNIPLIYALYGTMSRSSSP